MKNAMIPMFVWVVVLGLGQVSWAGRVSREKLVNSQDIMTAFEQGQSKVRVIVNLAKRRQLLTATDWNSRISSNTMRAEILTRQQEVLSTLTANDLSLRHRFENQPGFSAELTQKGLDKLLNHPSVESIEPVYTFEENLAQGIPLINALGYRSTYNGQGVAIAICDSGVDYYHPKLGNGPFPNGKVIGGYDFGDNDSDPSPNGPHGTACAGIAAGDVGATGDYIGGVAYGAVIYALKTKDSSGGHPTDSIVRAWDWCVTHKNDNPFYPILAISTSLTRGRFISTCDGAESALATAANNAVAAGITLLVSSGNDGYCNSIASPACLTNTISVGAVYDAALGVWNFCVDDGSCASPSGSATCDPGEFSARDATGPDSVTVYSNTASFLDILAPAHNTYTTDISGTDGYSAGDYLSDFGGTSAACPYAAGAVACLQSAAKESTGSYLTPSEVRNILTSTGDNITDGKVAITKPRINLGRAIDSIIPSPLATEYQSSDVPKEIQDLATVTSTLVISDTYLINDVDVKLNITHSYVGDLDVYLIAPDGTRVGLFTNVGYGGHNFSDTILDDEAAASIASGSAPFEGAYRPEGIEGTLADFDGKNVNGTWTLEITDDEKLDVGTLNSWSLIIEPYIICPLPPVPANPDPPDGDESVPVNKCLSWNDLDNAAYMDAHDSLKRTRRVTASTPSESSHTPAGFTVRDGVLVQGLSKPQNPAAPGVHMSASSSPNIGETLIDFDDVSAPCAFRDTVRLTDRYAALGVIFKGPGGNDGGAILNECAGFPVSGQSSPNFLAFDKAATLSDDGIPRTLEVLYFDPPVSSVQMLAASSDAGHLTMAAYAGNVMLDSATIRELSSVMSPISVQGPGITRVVIGYMGTAFVLDDLTFSPQQEQDCHTTWDVYVGTQPDALALVAGNLAEPNYCPGGLEANIWYYWQVVANNPANQTPGPIWSFKTTAAPVAICQDVTVAADSNCLGLVTVEDVNCCSYDPDGDPITLSLDPTGPYTIGIHDVNLIVTDDKGASDTCSANVTILPTAYCYKKDAIAILEGILVQDPNAADLIQAIGYLYLSLGDNDAADAVADMNDSEVAWAGPDRIAEWQGGFADVNDVFHYEQQACTSLDAYVHNDGAAFATDVNDALLLLAEAEKKLADTAIFDAIFHGADPSVIAAAKTLRSQGDAAKAEGGMKICDVALAKYEQAWQTAIHSLGPSVDHNRDGKVDIDDFVIWVDKWLESYPPYVLY